MSCPGDKEAQQHSCHHCHVCWIMNLRLDCCHLTSSERKNVLRCEWARSPGCKGWPWCQLPCFPENLLAPHCSAAPLSPWSEENIQRSSPAGRADGRPKTHRQGGKEGEAGLGASLPSWPGSLLTESRRLTEAQSARKLNGDGSVALGCSVTLL